MIPGIGMFLLDSMGLVSKAKPIKMLQEVAVISFALWVALPISVSLFPQKGEISATELEPEFREIRNGKGKIVDKFSYNKGL
jgi:hypothetical protein